MPRLVVVTAGGGLVRRCACEVVIERETAPLRSADDELESAVAEIDECPSDR